MKNFKEWWGEQDLFCSMDIAEQAWDAALDNSPSGKWVWVGDRMPEKSGVYICHFSDDVIETFSFTSADLRDHLDGYFIWGVHSYVVTHWMPLPEPPSL